MITTILLIKEDSLNKAEISNYYLSKLMEEGILPDTILVLPLIYNTSTKILAKTAKAYLDLSLIHI